MEIQIRHIPETADKWEVVRAISSVVHHPSFIEAMQDKGIQLVKGNMPLECMNFQVKLDMCENRGLRNKTTGTLLLCRKEVGYLFLEHASTDLPARVQAKKLKFYKRAGHISDERVKKAKVLEKTRFINPEIQEKRATASFHLRDGFTTVRALHIGFVFREGSTKVFSSEFQVKRYGQLWIEYEQKLFRIVVSVPSPPPLVPRVPNVPFSSGCRRWTKNSGASPSPSITSKGLGWAMTTEMHVCAHLYHYEPALDL